MTAAIVDEPLTKRIARAVLTWAVRGRAERGSEWGEALLAEVDETNGGWESLRWTMSGLRVAVADRRKRRSGWTLFGSLPPWRRRLAIGAVTVTVGLIGAFLVQSFVLTVHFIPSGSMEPTLLIGDRVLVDRVTFRITGLERGDVVAIRPSLNWGSEPVPDASDEDLWYVERVIGLPGDVVSCVDGRVAVNGDVLTEEYLPAGTMTDHCGTFRVPAGQLWVLGDHRSISLDSRYQGPVSEDDIVGRVLFTVWSGYAG
jgi:signal peptidase I